MDGELPEAAKPYAHKGRRRRKITDELFRCPHSIEFNERGAVGTGVLCGALLWRADSEALRFHLVSDHAAKYPGAEAMTDAEIQAVYIAAAMIPQEGVSDEDTDEETDGFSDD